MYRASIASHIIGAPGNGCRTRVFARIPIQNDANEERKKKCSTIRNSKQQLTQWHHYHLLYGGCMLIYNGMQCTIQARARRSTLADKLHGYIHIEQRPHTSITERIGRSEIDGASPYDWNSWNRRLNCIFFLIKQRFFLCSPIFLNNNKKFTVLFRCRWPEIKQFGALSLQLVPHFSNFSLASKPLTVFTKRFNQEVDYIRNCTKQFWQSELSFSLTVVQPIFFDDCQNAIACVLSLHL